MWHRLVQEIARSCAICLVGGAMELRVATPAAGLDCGVAAESTACASNEECACGRSGSSAQCEVGIAACVGDDRDCDDFCHGDDRTLVAVCRQGQCARARATRCPGDCDGDARVGVPELVTGVAIMLGERAQAACESLDADRDETSRVDELIAAVGGALRGCGAALPPVAGRRGTYDAILTGRSGTPFAGTRDAVADATQNDDGHGVRIGISIRLRPNRAITMSGRLNGATVALAGGYFVTDVGMPLTGTATITNTDEEEVIEGSLRLLERDAEESDASFVLRRSHTSTPVRFAGRYRFETSQSPGGAGVPSAFTVGLDIAPDGAALMSEATDIGPDETTLGSLMSGECFVAPGGHLRCSTLYLVADSVLSTRLRFTGALSDDGAAITGAGAFLSGLDPPIGPEPYVLGSWTARRLLDTP